MQVLENHSSGKSYGFLAVLSFAVWGIIALLMGRDVVRMQSQDAGEPEAVTVARKSMLQVADTRQGWFPYQRDPAYGWETGTQGWRLEADDPTALTPLSVDAREAETSPAASAAAQEKKTLEIVTGTASEGANALAVPVHFPDPATIFRDNSSPLDPEKVVGVRFISYDVFVPADCPGFVGCLFFVKDKDGLWYQARSRTALLPGRWTTVTADLRGDSSDVIPLGHLGQWDENQASRVRAIGVTFYGDREYSGRVLVDNFRAWMRPQRFLQMLDQLGPVPGTGPLQPERAQNLAALREQAAAFKNEPLRILNFRTEPASPKNIASVPKFSTLSLRFELNRLFDNPFDPDKVDVTCSVRTPGGKELEHIGFWYQDYDRLDYFDGEELNPIGRPEWRVRITPREEGRYKYTIRVKTRDEEQVELLSGEFESVPGAGRGFVKVSAKDPRYFEFENGEFFFPLGHNTHTPVDRRCWEEVFKEPTPAGRGLKMYQDFFDKMKASGENTAEIWMASWWVGIEWTYKWRNYYGAGRYSLQNAWKLDRLLAMAREHGINVHLVLDNHGKFSMWCDWEWELNPYNGNCDAGGPVTTAREFFTSDTARRWHRNKLRYIAARWGADPSIIGWELVSEYDLVGGVQRMDNARANFHRTTVAQNWAREMIEHLRRADCYGHLVTNHYASDYSWVDLILARSELFDYVVTDAYRPDRNYTGIANKTQNWARSALWRGTAIKPFWITEYGGNWDATLPPALDADVHCGIWATWMTEAAGTPLFWWYDFIDRKNLYTYYSAFAKYAHGEDRRGIEGVCNALPMGGETLGGMIQGSTYRWDSGAYGWVYLDNAMKQMPPVNERQTLANVEAFVPGLVAGNYNVEYWNTYTGERVKTESLSLKDGEMLPLHFPEFINDMAFKVKKFESK